MARWRAKRLAKRRSRPGNEKGPPKRAALPQKNANSRDWAYWPVVFAAALVALFDASMAAVEAVLAAAAELSAALAAAAVASAAAAVLSAAGLLHAARERAATAAPATINERAKVEVMIPGPLG